MYTRITRLEICPGTEPRPIFPMKAKEIPTQAQVSQGKKKQAPLRNNQTLRLRRSEITKIGVGRLRSFCFLCAPSRSYPPKGIVNCLCVLMVFCTPHAHLPASTSISSQVYCLLCHMQGCSTGFIHANCGLRLRQPRYLSLLCWGCLCTPPLLTNGYLNDIP